MFIKKTKISIKTNVAFLSIPKFPIYLGIEKSVNCSFSGTWKFPIFTSSSRDIDCGYKPCQGINLGIDDVVGLIVVNSFPVDPDCSLIPGLFIA